MDLSVPESSPALGRTVLGALGASARGLGVQRVIYWERLYDAHTPAGRPYSGPSPHRDHLHVEQTRASAEALTYPSAMALLDGVAEEAEDDSMLIVAWRGAQWVVRTDLTSKVGLSQSADVSALLAVGGGKVYRPAVLTEALMERIPIGGI